METQPDLTLISVLFWGIVTFSLVVVVHEVGHFFTARMFGVRVHEFVIGLPGPMLRLKTRSTTYGLSMVPLGGYVRIAGMEPGEEDELLAQALGRCADMGGAAVDDIVTLLGVGVGRARSLLETLKDYGALIPSHTGRDYVSTVERRDGETDDELLARVRRQTFRGKKPWQRIVILGTGVVLNLLFAILTFTFVLSAVGYDAPSVTIEGPIPDTPAEAAGFQKGDIIRAVDGSAVEDWDAVLDAIARHDVGDPISVTVERDGRMLTIRATLTEEEGRAFLGLQSRLERQRMPVLESIKLSLEWTGMVFEALVNLFRPDTFQTTIQDARGVVGVSVEAAAAASRGAIDYAWLVALLSLSLGALNIFPIPPLDGGKILFEVIAIIRKKPLSKEVYLGLTGVGAVLIFSLVIYLVYSDIIRYVIQG
ncbi:MAG: RIP metalloprotease RseP [Coriobacteriia bacterium]